MQSLARDSLLSNDSHRADTLQACAPAMTASRFAPDVVYLRAGAPAVFGRENVNALFASGPRVPAPVTCQPLGGGISVDALSGYTFGVVAYSTGDSRPVAIGRYISFWNRQKGARWEISAYAEVGDASPIASTTEVSAPAPVQPLMSRSAARAASAIAAADSDFADDGAIDGPGAAFANAVAADGLIFGGTEIVVGPRAIKAYFDARSGTSLSWHPTFAFAAASADLGFSVGESVATARSRSGAAVQHFGKYLTVWRRQPDGSWKFVVDGGNLRPSPVEKAP